jgi:hypothetical protein
LKERENIVWKRCREICRNPQMFVGGTESGDIIQGGIIRLDKNDKEILKNDKQV